MEKLEGGYLGFGLRSGAFEKGLTASDSVYLDDYTNSLKQQEIEYKAREEEMIRTSLLNKASHAAKEKTVFAMPTKAQSTEEGKMPVIVTKKKRKSDIEEHAVGNSDKNGDKNSGAGGNKKIKEEGNHMKDSSDKRNDETTNVNKSSNAGDAIARSAVSALAMYASDSD